MEEAGDLALPSLCGDRGRQDLFWRTVLLWLPCGWLWLSAVFYIMYLCHQPVKYRFCKYSRLNFIKSLSALLLLGLTLLDVCLAFTSGMFIPPVDFMYYSVRLITMVLVLVFTRWEYMVGMHTSGVLTTYWFLQLLCDIFILRSWVIRRSQQGGEDESLFITYCIYFALVCVSTLAQLFSDRSVLKSPDPQDEVIPLLAEHKSQPYDYLSKKAMPNLSAPFWRTLTFQWVFMDILRGNRSVVTFDRLYEIRPFDMCQQLLPKFYTVYNKNKSSEELPLRPGEEARRERASSTWALSYPVLPHLFLGFVLSIISLFCRVGQPLVLGWLLAWLESGDINLWQGALMALLMLILNICNSLFVHNYLYVTWMCGMRVRSVVNAVVYRKALRLSGSARKTTTTGEILNLMSVDAQKLQDMCTYGNLVWEVPCEVVLCMALIWNVIGVSTLAGLGVMLIIVPVNGFFVADLVRKLQAKQMVHKDERVKNINEVLSGMKIIKLYAWEPSFLRQIIDTRTRELYYLKLSNIISAVSQTFWYLLPYMVSLAIFATFVLISPDNVLDPSKAFVTMSLINVMNFTVSILPIGVSLIGQGVVSLKRVGRFLELDELEEGVVQQDYAMTVAVKAETADFSWEREGRTVLHGLDLEVPQGQLVAVVGHVGSGKSSLVSAILGEMVKHRGHITVNGSPAYVPQQAWIQNATVRDNILFGRSYHETRYSTVLDACALQPDLRILTDGDQTEIGEKGINLSGGQKQRVSLARAVYQNQDIYLLDDPLSAVDAHVGKHIFEKVISNKGLLRKKTRILVTHSIRFLRQVDTVIVMRNGKISEMGHFDKLVEQNGEFAEFLNNYCNEYNEYSSSVEEDIAALQSQLSAISGAESEQDSGRTKVQKKARRRMTTNKSSISEKSLSKVSAPAKLIEEETAEEGNVRAHIIWRYLVSGGLDRFVLVIIFQLLFTCSQVLTSFWLSVWSDDVPNQNGTMDRGLVDYRLAVYGGLGVGQGVFAAIALTAAMLGCAAASGNLHSDFINRIMRAPMAFFDTTPLGRIINRISKDLDLIDSNVPNYVRGFLFCAGPVLATAFVVSYTTPIFLAVFIPIAVIYAFGQRMYIKYVRQLKRIENIRRSPIYAHFDETINGTSSIRAYGRQSEFINKCDTLIDESQRPYYLMLVAQRWLGVTMEVIGGAVVFSAAMLVVFARDAISAGAAGMSISYSLNVTILFNSLVRCAAELETYMVSVERVDEYCNIDLEAEWRKPETETKPDWPTEGAISMVNYGTRYRPGLDLVLRNLTCNIRAGEKVGIVGRTGAGKSSLALALFRLIEAANGSINIDGVDISKLGLHNLRSRLTIIPQDPVIFSGSLRVNLDPFEEYSEEALWAAVDSAHLKPFVESLPEQLDYECGEGGQSLSVGQRQLVCLARALLRQTKVLVLDEATAAMDLETDSLIQATIANKFSHCTVLTVAHRLATVMDYDRIMVLDKGQVIEFDTPSELVRQTDSVFYSLAKEAGVA